MRLLVLGRHVGVRRICRRQLAGQRFGQRGQLRLEQQRFAAAANFDGDRLAGGQRSQCLLKRVDVLDLFAVERLQAVARLDSHRGRRTVRINVPHDDARIVRVAESAHRQNAEEGGNVGLDLVGQLHFAVDSPVAPQRDDAHRFAGVERTQLVLQLGLSLDRLPGDFDDLVAGAKTGFVCRSGGPRGGDHGRSTEHVVSLERDAQQPPVQVLSLLELGKHAQEGFERNGKADARVVPFDARDFGAPSRRHRHQHAQHASVDIDQRPAVVVGRDLGVGLNRLAPDS